MSARDETRELARRVAHAIRTPLGVIGGALEHLRDGTNATIDRAQLVQLAERGLAQIGRLADRLGMLGAIERGLEPRHQPTALHALAEAAIADVARGRRRRGVEVALEPGTDATVACDPALMRAALAEVIDNAVRFARKRVNVSVDAERARVVVDDDGPATELPAPVGTGSPPTDRAGLGIGLWMAGRIVEAHGGSVEHERAGDVTRFIVSFGASG